MTEITTQNGAMIDDRRGECSIPVCYLVATDQFMSGWGLARDGRSLFAVAIPQPHEISGRRPGEIVTFALDVMQARREFKRPREVGAKRRHGVEGLPDVRLHPGDHLSVRDWTTASAFYPGET